MIANVQFILIYFRLLCRY